MKKMKLKELNEKATLKAHREIEDRYKDFILQDFKDNVLYNCWIYESFKNYGIDFNISNLEICYDFDFKKPYTLFIKGDLVLNDGILDGIDELFDTNLSEIVEHNQKININKNSLIYDISDVLYDIENDDNLDMYDIHSLLDDYIDMACSLIVNEIIDYWNNFTDSDYIELIANNNNIYFTEDGNII